MKRAPQPLAATPPANFDRIAGAYRWMEYVCLGTLLEQTRFCWLGTLGGCRQALVLGDGDGRFTARLLGANQLVRVTAVDESALMLRLLKRRCSPSGNRLATYQCDARQYDPPPGADLVVSHFFLDCLSQAQVEELVRRLKPLLAPDATWLVSEFRIAEGWLRWPARLLVRLLYLAFRVLTGLRITRLPDHGKALAACGFQLTREKRFCGGLLTAEVWRLPNSASREKL